MIRIFNRNRNAIGQFMVALIFLGTFGFLFTFDGFVSKSQASGCCGGGEAAVISFTADSSGDFGSDIPMDTSSQNHIMNKVIPSSSNNNGDGDGDGDCDCTCIEGAAVLVMKINVRKHHTSTVRTVVATLAQMTFMDVVAIKAPHIVQTMNSLLKYVVRLATVAVNAKYVRKF